MLDIFIVLFFKSRPDTICDRSRSCEYSADKWDAHWSVIEPMRGIIIHHVYLLRLFGAFSTLTILSNMRNRKWQIPPRFMLLHITSDLAIENSFLAVEFFFYVFDTTVCNVLLSIRYDTFGVKNLNNDKCSPLAVNLMFWFFWGGLFTMRKMTNKHYEKASFEGYSLFVETV